MVIQRWNGNSDVGRRGHPPANAANCQPPLDPERGPEMPKENALHSGIHTTRRMSISREKEIASNLAFLSATSDDCLKMMAVCVEEHRNGEGTTIRITSNTGDLSEVTNGFASRGAGCAARSVGSRPSSEI